MVWEHIKDLHTSVTLKMYIYSTYHSCFHKLTQWLLSTIVSIFEMGVALNRLQGMEHKHCLRETKIYFLKLLTSVCFLFLFTYTDLALILPLSLIFWTKAPKHGNDLTFLCAFLAFAMSVNIQDFFPVHLFINLLCWI